MLKSIALKSVSKGWHLPQNPVERLNELHFLRELLEHLHIDCVLDVGANRGQFASELRGIGFRGQILSFEPISTEFQAMRARFANDARWRGHQFALGSEEKTLSIHIPKLTVMSSLLDSATDEKTLREEQVQVKRLDALLPGLMKEFGVSRPFLKMDTQGYDLEVFKGAAGCMDAIQGLQSELSVQALYKNMPHYTEALATYEAAGFLLYNLSTVNRTEDGGLLEMNCFMRRRA